jgi:hypothetical protein
VIQPITNTKELKLEILRRKTLVSHQEKVIKEDFYEMVNSVTPIKYLGKLTYFFVNNGLKPGNFFLNLVLGQVKKMKKSSFFKDFSPLLSAIPGFFRQDYDSSVINKISTLWKKLSGFFGRKDKT